MKEQTGKDTGQKSVLTSPIVLIALGAALIGVAAMYLFPGGTTPSGQDSPPNNIVINPNTIPVKTGNPASPSPLPEASKYSAGSTRDPFLLPKLALQVLKKSSTQEQPRNVTNLQSANSSTTSNKENEPEQVIIWRGLASIVGKKVAIVNYRQKTFLLQPGQLLPGSEYRLTDIKNDTIIFNSATHQLKVARIKGDTKK